MGLFPLPPLRGKVGMGGMTTQSARVLRNHLTDTERVLWRHLRLRQLEGHKFRRQHPIGPYIVDFVCLEKRVIIEVDGGHHAEQGDDDASRTAWLQAHGFCVLRFWNHEVLTSIEAVAEQIRNVLIEAAPPPLSSPARGEEK